VSESATNSLDVEIVVDGGPSLPTGKEPVHPSVQLWLDYERDRVANPNTPRPYRPYLTPPPHLPPAPTPEPGAET
jgi:hypothetical protein